MAGFLCRSTTSTGMSHSKIVVPSAATSSSLAPSGFRQQEAQYRLWKDLFSNPWEWWDNRQEKRSPRHPDFRHKITRESLWLNNQHKPAWVESQLDILDARRGEQGTWGAETWRPSDDAIRGLCEEGQLENALIALCSLDQHGLIPSVGLYRSLLKACTKKKALAEAKQIHAHLAKHQSESSGFLGFGSSRFLGEYMVITLVKCGGLEEALQVFHRLPERGVLSWTAVISGYTLSGQGREALKMFQMMREEGVQPNAYTFVSVLKACGSIADLEEGKRLHAEVLMYRYESNVFVANCLVDMYGKCGSILDAYNVFDALSHRDVVSWNTLLAAYAQQGQAERALEVYEQMREQGSSPNERTFVSTLQACCMLAEKEDHVVINGVSTKVNSLEIGRSVHADARRKGCDLHVYVGSTLVRMYGKCGSIVDAQNVFDGLYEPAAVSWTALLTSYIELGQSENAMQLYQRMRDDGILPDAQTFLAVLQACSMQGEKEGFIVVDGGCTKVKALEQAKAIHADVRTTGYCSDVFVGSMFVSTYAKCGSIKDAQHVFDGLTQVDVVGWTAMLAAYTRHGQANKALQMYELMREENVSPDARTFVSALQACGMLAELQDLVGGHPSKVQALEQGKAIHADAQRKGCISDTFVGNTLISMYGKCGSIEDAWIVFQGLSHGDVVSWNTIIMAYVQQGEGEKALQLYNQMRDRDVSPDEVTILCLVHACSITGNLDMLRQFHQTLVVTRGNLSSLLANTLIHAYGRCASMVDSQTLFDALPQPDVVSWNSLIAGYARQGDFGASLQCYERMQVLGGTPNGVTFLSLLSACSHAGLVDKGIEYFESMSRDHGITPEMEHYVSMVDLLGRVGCFSSVLDLVWKIPQNADLALWLCVLAACRKHGDVMVGKQAFDHAVQLQPKHAATYVLMSNIYADAGLLDCANNVMVLGETGGAWRKPSQSWIEHDLQTHTFMVGDYKHFQREQLYAMLRKASSKIDSTSRTPTSGRKGLAAGTRGFRTITV